MASPQFSSPTGTPSIVRLQPNLARNNPRRPIFLFSSFVFILLLIVPIVYSSLDVSPDLLVYPMSVAFTILFAVQIWAWRQVSGSLFDPYAIFLGAAMLFNGSHAILEVFQLNHAGVLGTQFSSETTLRTIYLVTLGLWSFHLGGLIAPEGYPRRLAQSGTRSADYNGLRTVGWFLIAVAIVPSFVLLQRATSLVLSSGYFALFQRETATSVNALPEVLAAFLVPGTLLVAAASKGRRFQLGITAGLIGLYALTQLFLGSRALVAASLVPYVWLWHRSIKPLPKIPILIGGCVLVFILMPLVGASRGFTGEDRVSPGALLRALYGLDNPAVSIISEMGGTAITIGHTIDLVPTSRPYDYGASYAWGALTLVPNFFWEVHPTIAHGSPNTWLAQTVDREAAARGGGLGYSFLAEAYLNAGWIGVILASAILGFAFAKLAAWVSISGEPAKVAFAAVILAVSLKYVRSDCYEIIRAVVWYALCPYALVRMIAPKSVSSLYFQSRLRVSKSPRTSKGDTWK